MSESQSEWLVIAHLVRPQGRKGELLAELLTDFPDRFSGMPRVFLAPLGFAGGPDDARSVHVTTFWLPKGKSEGRIVLGFDVSQSISDAEALAGNDVLVPLKEKRVLTGDAVYVHDLIGCAVFDGEHELGTVGSLLSLAPASSSEQSPETAPVLVVHDAAEVEYLIPFARAYLRGVDLSGRRILMTLPEDLIDLYRSTAQKRKAKPNESTG